MKFLLIILKFSCLSLLLNAQTSSFERKLYLKRNDTLPYRLQPPLNTKAGRKYPLVLFLHGSGAIGRDNESQLKKLPVIFTDSVYRKNYPCYVLAPQCLPKDAWSSFPNFPNSIEESKYPTKSTTLVLELLDSLLKNADIDPTRIYVTGLSLGGEGVFDIITRKPRLFAAAVPICGVADTSKTNLMVSTPLWIFHGDADDVNEVKYSRMIVEDIKKRGGKPRYTEYPGVKHNSWINAYKEKELLPWIFNQKCRKN